MQTPKGITAYLKYRFFCLPLLFLEIIRNPFYKNFIDSSDSLREFFKHIFFKSALINNITDNAVVLINGQLHLLAGSITLILFYLAVDVVLNNVVRYHRNAVGHAGSPAAAILPHLIWTAVFCFAIQSYSPLISVTLTLLLGFVYTADFVFFNNDSFFSTRIKRFSFFMFSLAAVFLAEGLCFPLYMKFLYCLQGRKIPPVKARIIQWGHYSFFIFFVFLMVSPLNSPSIIEMQLLQKGCYFDLQYYEKGDALIVLNDFEGQVEQLSMKYMTLPRVLYKSRMSSGTEDSMGDWLSVNNETQELYFTDRSFHELMILDLTTHAIKKTLSSAIFNAGDNFIAYLNNHIYGITEEGACIYKIDPQNVSPVESMLKFCIQEGEGSMLVPHPQLNVLYATNWNEPSSKFFIYKIDADTLAVLGRFPLSSPGIVMVSEDGERLYCGVSTGPVNIFTIDARSLRLVDRFLIPYGSENAALDKKRELLFAANHFTNIVEVIDLKTQKTFQYFRAGEGRSYIRRIIVDAPNKRFFVTVFNEGIYGGAY